MPNFFDVIDHFLYQSLATKVAFRQISDDEYVAILPEMLPEHIKIEFLDQMKYLNEFGYYNSKSVGHSQQHLAWKPRTWADFVKTADWSEARA